MFGNNLALIEAMKGDLLEAKSKQKPVPSARPTQVPEIFTVRLPAELAAKIRQRALANGISLHALFEHALTREVNSVVIRHRVPRRRKSRKTR